MLLLPRSIGVVDDHHVLPVIDVCVSLDVISLTHRSATRWKRGSFEDSSDVAF